MSHSNAIPESGFSVNKQALDDGESLSKVVTVNARSWHESYLENQLKAEEEELTKKRKTHETDAFNTKTSTITKC